jgi:crotonobetainyl-CoA:carnitine CoA-transferase CaiB-like acyl-CoA transferase
LYGWLASCLVELGTATWLALLTPLDIPCSPINSIEDLLEDEHLQAVDFFKTVDHPTEGRIVSIRPPIRFSRTLCDAALPAPALSRRRDS